MLLSPPSSPFPALGSQSCVSEQPPSSTPLLPQWHPPGVLAIAMEIPGFAQIQDFKARRGWKLHLVSVQIVSGFAMFAN